MELTALLEMTGSADRNRRAIVVAESDGIVLGLIVAGVSEIPSIRRDEIQPLRGLGSCHGSGVADGIIPFGRDMNCLLDLDCMLACLGRESLIRSSLSAENNGSSRQAK